MAEQDVTFKVSVTGAQEAEAEFARVNKARKEATEDLVDKLKSGFGRNAAFTQFAKIASGGGAVLGLGLASRELEAFTAKLKDVQQIMADGAGAGEIAVKLGESLPILGGMITAGQNIREMAFGEQKAIDAINESIKLQTQYTDASAASARRIRDIYAETREIAVRTQKEISLVGLSGPGRDFKSHRDDIEQAQANVSQAIAASVGGRLNVGTAPDDLRKIAEDIQGKYAGQINQNQAKASELSAKFSRGGGQATKEDYSEYRTAADAVKNLQKDQANDIAAAQKKYMADNKATIEKGQAENAQLRKDFGRADENFRDAQAQRVANIEAAAVERHLRLQGDSYKADLVGVHRAYDEQNAAIEKALADRQRDIENARKGGIIGLVEAGRDQVDALANAIRLRAANKADEHLGENAAGSEQTKVILRKWVEHLADTANDQLLRLQDFTDKLRNEAKQKALDSAINSGIHDEAIAGLSMLASGGNRAAQLAVQRDQIHAQIAEQRGRLQALIASGDAQQKADAQKLLDGLSGQESAAIRAAGMQGVTISPFAQSEQGYAGAGDIARAKETAFFSSHPKDGKKGQSQEQLLERIAKATEEKNNQRKMDQVFDALLSYLKAQDGRPPLRLNP